MVCTGSGVQARNRSWATLRGEQCKAHTAICIDILVCRKTLSCPHNWSCHRFSLRQSWLPGSRDCLALPSIRVRCKNIVSLHDRERRLLVSFALPGLTKTDQQLLAFLLNTWSQPPHRAIGQVLQRLSHSIAVARSFHAYSPELLLHSLFSGR